MTIVAFKKGVYLKAKQLFESTEVLYLRKKHLISINGKKKLKRILNQYSIVSLVEGEKFKSRNLPSTSSLTQCSAANSVGTSLEFAAFGSRPDTKFSRASAFWFFLSTTMVLRRTEHIFPEKTTACLSRSSCDE